MLFVIVAHLVGLPGFPPHPFDIPPLRLPAVTRFLADVQDTSRSALLRAVVDVQEADLPRRSRSSSRELCRDGTVR
jgi:hypothetical protein